MTAISRKNIKHFLVGDQNKIIVKMKNIAKKAKTKCEIAVMQRVSRYGNIVAARLTYIENMSPTIIEHKQAVSNNANFRIDECGWQRRTHARNKNNAVTHQACNQEKGDEYGNQQ